MISVHRLDIAQRRGDCNRVVAKVKVVVEAKRSGGTLMFIHKTISVLFDAKKRKLKIQITILIWSPHHVLIKDLSSVVSGGMLCTTDSTFLLSKKSVTVPVRGGCPRILEKAGRPTLSKLTHDGQDGKSKTDHFWGWTITRATCDLS